MSSFISLLREYQAPFINHYGAQIKQEMHRAITAMLTCQTELQSSLQWHCTHCHFTQYFPLSCGHRSCPQCQHRTTKAWLEKQQQKLLPTHYFMLTLTLPYQLRPLMNTAPKALYQSMFAVASKLLKDFAKRQNRGKLGFTAVLHTHNRKREPHPHLHIIVAAGRYDPSKKCWHKGDKNYLFNEFALAKVWRARMMAAINHHPEMTLPSSLPKSWYVDCRSVGRGLPAFKYLSRYLYRGVLPDKDIINIKNGQVTFRYQESATKKWANKTLPVLQFLWRILQHVLPKGFQRVRDYGFLCGNAKKCRLQILRLLIQSDCHWFYIPTTNVDEKASRLCPCCQHKMCCIFIARTT